MAYSDRKKAAPIDRFSVDVKNKIETYLSQSLQSNSVPFDSSTLSSAISSTVPQNYIGRNEMIQKLFSRFYDPENIDSNMKYAVLAS